MRVTEPTLWGSSGSGIPLRLATLLRAVGGVGVPGGGWRLLGAAPFRERFRPAGWIGVAGFAGLPLLPWPARLPLRLLLIPTLWVMLGISAASAHGIAQDYALPVASVVACGVAVWTKSRD